MNANSNAHGFTKLFVFCLCCVNLVMSRFVVVIQNREQKERTRGTNRCAEILCGFLQLQRKRNYTQGNTNLEMLTIKKRHPKPKQNETRNKHYGTRAIQNKKNKQSVAMGRLNNTNQHQRRPTNDNKLRHKTNQ